MEPKNVSSTAIDNKLQRLSVVEKAGYALGDAASNIYFQLFVTYIMIFYTDVFGLPAATVGTMFLVSRIFDAINDPIIGSLADRMNTRWGKFRPFVFFFAVPLAGMGVLAFTSPAFDDPLKLAYAYLTYNLLMVCYTLVNVPYASLMGVITPNSMERVGLSSYRFVGAFVGGLIVQSATLVLVDYYGGGDNPQLGWQLTMATLGVLVVVFLFITFITTRERVEPPPGQKMAAKKDILDLLANHAWRLIAIATVFQLIFIVMRNTAITYYFRYYVGEQTISLFGWEWSPSIAVLTSTFLTSGMVITILGVILTRHMAKRFDKKMTYIVCMGTSAVLSVGFFVLPADAVITMFLINTVISFVWGPVSVLQWAMYTDAADYGEWKHNRRITGLVMAASLFALKMGLALGGAITGWVLGWYGFVPNVDQTERSLTGIVMIMSFLPAMFGIVCVGVMARYPLTNATMEDIERDLVARRLATKETEGADAGMAPSQA
ncbi:MFS transporter [Marinimicrobium alkaliphilum]|uniref:MFS transporter n=1 Tax=Marinimicrobium alkaliphilum TaxID=2202654 RepID=UPI0018E0B883|nr:MFS transporter [Marinimicrobium alkaliphilum]